MARKVTTGALLGGLLAVGAVVATTALTRPADIPATLAGPSSPASAPVSTQTFGDDRSVPVRLDLSDATSLRAQRSGRITETLCRPGRVIRSGTALTRLDEQVVMAVHTDVPIYRSLRLGSKGRDVRSLQTELRRLGYAVRADGEFGTRTRLALRALENRVGLTRPDGVLQPDEMVWLPELSVVPDTCDAVLGASVSVSSPLATMAGRLTAVRATAMPSGIAAGQRRLELFGQSALLHPSGVITDVTFLRKVQMTDEFASYVAAGANEKVTATISLAKPIMALKVPPGSVFAITGASGCIQTGERALPVTIVGSGLGASLVAVAGTAPSRVNLGPAITRSACGGAT